jgi:hypothetical protein
MADNTLQVSKGRTISWEVSSDSDKVVIVVTHQGVSWAAINAVRNKANRRGKRKIYNCVAGGFIQRGKLHLVMDDMMLEMPIEAQIQVTMAQICTTIGKFREPRGRRSDRPKRSRRSRNARDRQQQKKVMRSYRGNNFKGAPIPA